MKLDPRLRRLERLNGVGGSCPECLGAGRFAFQIEDGEAAGETPSGCPRCGDLRLVAIRRARREIR